MTNCTYDPQNFNNNFPNTLPVTTTELSIVTFEYPYDTPTLSLELKTPELNDQEAIDLSRIQDRSLGGTLIVYRDPTWPRSISLSLSFRNLSYIKRNEILTFVEETLGKEIKYTDHLNQVYKLIITNPQDFLSEEHGNCGFTWKTNMQGILT